MIQETPPCGWPLLREHELQVLQSLLQGVTKEIESSQPTSYWQFGHPQIKN